jgi:hypothetical protein
MEYPVFYSWQNDLPKKCNRTFIREALDEAVRNITAEGQVEDSPRVDSGMEGIAGSPEVASVMFEKIDRCALLVADTTLVGTIVPVNPDGETKRVPKPNVSLEMGVRRSKDRLGSHHLRDERALRFAERPAVRRAESSLPDRLYARPRQDGAEEQDQGATYLISGSNQEKNQGFRTGWGRMRAPTR